DGVRQYLFVKTVISLITAATSYAILRYLGLDFAETWALIIFFLNYIPSIGSALGVVFPALLALVQFDTITPFFVLAIGLTALQFSIGNILEPALMGRSLNLSPFVIIVSLAFWSTIWGVAGAFLAVPITAVIVILCREIKGCEWVAVLLSNAETKPHP
ncbi:MAG: AI-2E family transporter, partial [Pseudomonadota bacterium]